MPLCCSSPSLSRAAGRPSLALAPSDTQTVPNLSWLHLPFFSFTGMQKRYAFSRNCTLNFEFGSFPDLETCDTSPSVLLGSDGHSCEPGDHEGKQPTHLEPSCIHSAMLLFPCRTAFHKLHGYFNT